MTKLFLDSTVMISTLTSRNPASTLILIEQRFPLYTNEYVIKEIRRALGSKFDFTPIVSENRDFDRIDGIVRIDAEKYLGNAG